MSEKRNEMAEWYVDEECGRCGLEMKTDGFTRWCPLCHG